MKNLNIEDYKKGGIVLRAVPSKNDLMKISYDDGKFHNIVIGTTGSGKSQMIVIPSILSIANTNASMVINDPKGELASLTSEYLKKKGYRVVIMDYFDPKANSCFNQLLMVNQEYEKGLPHFYNSKAISFLMKMIDIISSGGDVNDLKSFQAKKFQGSLPILIQQNAVEGRTVSEGVGSKKVTTVMLIDNFPEFNSDNLKALKTLTPKNNLIEFIYDICTHTYNQIQEDAIAKKEGGLLDIFKSNEHLKYRQEKVLQSAVELLTYAHPENLETYYKAKIAQNQLIMTSADKLGTAYQIAEELTNKYTNILSELDAGNFTTSMLREFLVDIKADHDAVWSECESNAATYADAIAKIIAGKDSPGGDPFWTVTAQSLIRSIILFVCRESNLNYSKHLGSVSRVLASLTTADSSGKSELDRIFDRLLDSDSIKLAQSEMRVAGDKTKASILASALAAMNVFTGNPAVCEQASRTEFNPETLATERTAVFLITPGKDDAGSAQFTVLATLFIEQMYSILNRYLNRTKDQTLPRPVYFILDEICNIPPIPELGSKITLARSKNIRISLFIQSYEQLKTNYRDDAETIKENSQIMYLLSNSTGTSKEIVEKIGKATIEINSFSSSDNKSVSSSSTSTSSTGRDLFTAQELMQLPEETGIYMRQRQQPYQTTLTYAYKWPIYSWLKDNQIANVHFRRNPAEVNYFAPRSTDFTAAYELLYNDCILDKFAYNIFTSISVPSNSIELDEIELDEEIEDDY